MRFKDGELYTVEQIAGHVFGNTSAMSALPPGTLFRYSRDPRFARGHFDQVIEPENPLISSEQAQRAVEHMREHGMSLREIARLAGVSVESVHRSASGVGRIRASTQEAILTVAASLNGHG